MRSFVIIAAGTFALIAVLLAVSSSAAAETVVAPGTYTTGQTWTLAGSPYNLTGAVIFRNSATVTIEPGVVVRGASSSAYLQIGTSAGYCCNGDAAFLNALGTEASPITFEAGNASQGWGGLRWRTYYANQPGGTLQNVTITGATTYAADLQSVNGVTFDNVTFDSPGTAGMYLSASSPTIKSSSFVGSLRGILGTWDSRPTVTGSDFSGQTVRYGRVGIGATMSGLTFDGGAVAMEMVTANQIFTTSQRITAISAPYEMLEYAQFRNGATLTLDPGVHIKAVPAAYIQIGTSAGYCCNGDAAHLDASGTAAAPILIEAANPATGWGGLRFRTYFANQPDGVLRNVTLAGATSYNADLQSVNGVTFDNVTFATPGVAGLYLSASSPTIVSSSFVGGPRGIYALTWDSRPTISSSSFTDQTARWARVGFGSPLTDLTFTGTGSAVELVTQNTTLTSSARVRAIGAPYELIEWIAIRNGATLTIDAGAHIKALPWAYIQVGTNAGYCCNGDAAHLDAAGTPEAPIVLEASNTTAGWGGLRFRTYFASQADGWLRNATVRRASGYGVDIQGLSGVTLDNVTFDSNTVAGLYLAASSPTVRSSSFVAGQRGILVSAWDSRPTLVDTSFTGQTVRHARIGITSPMTNLSFAGTGTSVELLTGEQLFLTSIRLSPLSVPYELVEYLAMRANTTLTLDPGLHMKVAPTKYIQIGTNAGYGGTGDYGHLVALGTEAQPILLESSSGLNTTGWGGLRFRNYFANTADGTLRNVTVADVAGSAIDILTTNGVRLDNVTVQRPTSHGVLLASSATTTIMRATFNSTGGYGVFASDTSSGATITDTVFSGNSGRPWRLRITDAITNPTMFGHVNHEVEYYGADVTTSRTLTTYFDDVTAEPYASVFLSSFTVYNTATWTVSPGSRVLVADQVVINIGSCCSNPSSRGNITAEGTAALPISFASRSGSATNGWYGFYFRGDYGGGVAILRNTTIAFSRDDAIDTYYYGSMTLDNVTLNGNARYGAQLVAGGPYRFNETRIARSASHGLYITSGAAPILRGGVIENSGGYGVVVSDAGASVNLIGTAIQNSTQRAARVRMTDTFLPASLTNNTIRDVEYWGTDITSNRSLALWYDAGDGGKYTSSLLSSFTVYNQATFTIPANTTLLVDNAVQIAIGSCCTNPTSRGNLTAEGTEAEPILITSRSGNNVTGWYGLYFRGDYGAGHTVIRNTTLALSRDANLETYVYSDLLLDNVTLDRSQQQGMIFYSSNPTLMNVDVIRPGWEAMFFSSSNPVWRNGLIEHTGRSGFYASGCGQANLYDLVVERPNGYGFYADGTCNGANLNNVQIRNATGRAWRLRTDNTIVNSDPQNATNRELEYWGADLTTNRTLTLWYDAADGGKYTSVLLSSFTVYNQATYTIPANTTLLVENAVQIAIGSCCTNPTSRGNLTAEGTAAEPILITSRSGNNVTGWYGLYFRGDYGAGHTVIRNTTLALSRDANIETYTYSDLLLDNVTLDRSQQQGMIFYSSNPTLMNVDVIRPGWEAMFFASSNPVWRNGFVEHTGRSGFYASGCGIATLQDIVVERATGYGFYADGSCNGAHLDNVQFLNATGRAWRNRLDTRHDSTIVNAGVDELEYWGIDLTADRTLLTRRDGLDNARLTSVILSSFTVYNQATWTVAPDNRVLVENAVSISIGSCCNNPVSRGNLTALGTEAEPIVFTSRTGSSVTGWYGMYFRGDYGAGTSIIRNTSFSLSRDDAIETYVYHGLVLDNVTLDHNARWGAYIYSSSPTLNNVRVWANNNHGLWLEGSANPTIRGGVIENNLGYGAVSTNTAAGAQVFGTTFANNTQRPLRVRITDTVVDPVLRNNTIREIEYWGVDITSNKTLQTFYDDATAARYASVIMSTFTVYNQATWTVAPDNRVLVENAVSISIGSCCSNPTTRGNLTALGTEAEPIAFTSRSGLTSTGWYGMYFRGDYGAGTSIIRNASFSLSRDDGIETYVYHGLTLDNVTLDHNARWGAYLYSSSPTLNNVRVWANNNHGLLLEGSANPTIRGGVIESNLGYGAVSTNSAAGAQVFGTTFANNTQRPLRVRITDTVADPILRNNTIREVEYWGADMTSDRTLAPFYDAGDNGRHSSVIMSTFTVYNQATWTILPDVRLLVENAVAINIGSCCSNPSSRGNLTAEGTAAQPITFTSRTGSSATGWYGAYFRADYALGGTSVVRNATFALSRDDGIETTTYSGLSLDNVTLDRNARWGAYINGGTAALRNVVSNGSGNYGMYFLSTTPTWSGGGVTGSASHGIYWAGCGAGTLRDITVANTNGYGMYADSTCNGAHMDGVTFSNTTGRPFRNRLDASMTNVTAINPGIREVELWGMTIGGARTLTLEPVRDQLGAPLPTVMIGGFTVNGGAELALAPDLQLRFRANEGMQVGSSSTSRGTLTSRGTSDRRVNISGVSGWGAGWLAGINFEWTTRSVLQNTTLYGVNENGIRVVNGGMIALDNVTVQRAVASGVVVGASSRAYINNSYLYENTGPGVFVDNGGILEMTRSNASRNVQDGLNVRAGTGTVRGSTFFENGRSGVNATSGNPALTVNESYLWRNAHYGVNLQGSTGSTVVNNAFIENVQGQARATAWNRWNLTPTLGRNIAYGPLLGGNSWSDYPGEDTDADGLGDTLVPYVNGLTVGGDSHPVMGNLYADFSVEIPDIVNLPRELTFHDASRGGFSPADQWVWDLGDGSQFVTQDVTHAYAEDGSYPVQLLVANPHGQVSSLTRTVHVDSIAPITSVWLNGTIGLDGWHVSAVNVTLNASDDRSGINRTLFRLDGGNVTLYNGKFGVTSNGVHNVTFWSVDRNGNTEVAQSVLFQIDRTLPVALNATLVGTLGNAGWYVSNTTALLNGTDNVSGVDHIEYAFNATPNQTYEGGVLIGVDGTTLVRFRAIDNAGLVSSEKNVTVRRDATPPLVSYVVNGTLGGGGFFVSNASAILPASDAMSSLAYLNYTLDGGASTPFNGSVPILGHGNHTLAAIGTDVAGNTNASLDLTVRIDLLPPVSEHHFEGVLGANGVYVSPVNISFSGNDSGSGIDHYVYSLDGGPNTTFTTEFGVMIDGQHRLVYHAVDVAGNVETIHEVIVFLDLAAPTTTLNLAGAPGQNGWFLSNVSANLSVDSYESLDSIFYALDGGSSTTYVTDFPVDGDGIHNLTYHAVSIGGLVEEDQLRLVRIDLFEPSLAATLAGTSGTNGWYITPVAATLTPLDSASGIATTLVAVDGGPLATYTGAINFATSGPHLLGGRTSDVAGRSSDMEDLAFQLDLDDPVSTLTVTPALPNGANGWYVTQPTLSFGATDIGAGVDSILVSIDGGPETPFSTGIVLGEGVHLVQYRALDLAGRSETLRNATIRVDLSAPSLAAALSGAEGAAGWYVSIVNATLTPTDATSGVAQIFARVNGGPEQAITGAISLTTTRTHTIAWRAVDAAGLVANETFSVKVDRSAPTTTPTITPSPVNGWRNQVATVTLAATDQPGFGSGVASIESGLDGAPLTTYTGPFNVGEGFHNLSFRGIDIAGLVNTTITQALNVDLTPPTIGYAMRAPDANGWYLSSVPVNFTATDALSGFATIEWWIDNGGHTNTSSLVVTLTQQGTHVLHVRARDVAGLASAILDIPFSLDTSVPTLTHTLTGGTFGGNNRTVAWYRTPVNLTLVPVDLGSGIAQTQYRLDGAPNATYAGVLRFATDGAHNVSAWATDNVGRISTQLNVPAFGVDLTPPTTIATLAGGYDDADQIYKTAVTLTLAANDTLSGVGSGLLRVNNGSGWVTYAGARVYDLSGTYSLDYHATDVAGNVEAIHHLVFTVFVDTTPPVTTLAPPPTGWYGAPVTARLSASDTESSILSLLYRLDGGDLQTILGNATNISIATEGIHQIEYAAIDVAGNEELFRTATYQIDLTPPSLAVAESFTQGANGWIVSPVDLTPTATDALSGIANVKARVNGAEQTVNGTLRLAQSGFYNVTMWATDLGGLVSNTVSWSGRLDLDAPRPTVSVVGTQGMAGWLRGNASVLLAASDAITGSGLDLIEYNWDNTTWAEYPGVAFQFTQEGLHWLQVRAVDLAGNAGFANGTQVGIDLTRPVIDTDLDGTAGLAGWWKSPVTATTSVADLPGSPGAATSGVHNFTRIVDGGANQSAALPSVVDFATSGVHSLSGFALDLALNFANQTISIPVDVEDPTLDYSISGPEGLSGWYVGPVTLTAASLDPTSGPAAPLLNGAPMPAPQNYTADGIHALILNAVDVAGRTAPNTPISIPIDTTPPEPMATAVGDQLGEGGWFHGNATVSLSMLDATSGAGDIRFRVDNGSLFTYAGPFNLTTDGIHVIDWVALDVAGNLANSTFVVKLDNEIPVAAANLSGLVGNNSWFRSGVNITLNATDLTSGVTSIEYRLDGGLWLPYLGEPIRIDTEGRHTLEYRAIDGSGLPSFTYYHEILIDITTPVVDLHLENTLFIEFDGKLYIRGTLCIEVSGLDLLSGLNDLYLRVTGVITKLVKIELEVGLTCIDLEGEGGGGGGGCLMCAIASDLAGNEELSCLEGVFDPGAPYVDIVRPFPGALNLQNSTIPLFSAAFQNGVLLDDPGIQIEEETPDGKKTIGGPVHVSGNNATLAQTRLVAGTRVPVWVAASDGLSPITRVELRVDDKLVGISNKTENVTFQYVYVVPNDSQYPGGEPTAWIPSDPAAEATPNEREHRLHVVNVTIPVYKFEVDTLALTAGDHNFTAKAWDVPGNLAKVVRLVGFVSPAVGNLTVNTMEQILADKGMLKDNVPNEVKNEFPLDTWEENVPDFELPSMPAALRDRVTTMLTAARIAARLYDFLVVDNYAFVDRTVVEEVDAYERVDEALASLPVQAPPVVIAGMAAWLDLFDANEVADLVPEELPIEVPDPVDDGGEDE